MLQRICKQCGRSFQGGPRAFYCTSCRMERKRIQKANYIHRRRMGNVRLIGSKDRCEICGKEYIVVGSLQRFCPDCQPIHAREYDQKTAIEFYHSNKDRINPVRYERRRKPPKKCAWCGKEFTSHTRTLTCSVECRRLLKNKKWNEKYGKLRKEQRVKKKMLKGG